jgi:hypothetical protein
MGAFIGLGIGLVLYLGPLGYASIARSQGQAWGDTVSEWMSTVWYSSIWLMAISAILIVVLIVAQIIWAYLPWSSSRH